MEISVDPHLYPFLLELVTNYDGQVTIVDFGVGTKKLTRDLLYRDPTQNVGLRNIPSDTLTIARKKIDRIVGFEINQEYVAYGKAEDKRFDEGNDVRTEYYKINLERETIPLPEKCVDIAVSRHFITQLSPAALSRHFKEVKRILGNGCQYVFTVTNPYYEQLRYRQEHPNRPDLMAGQGYEYLRGVEKLNQYYRPFDYYIKDIQNAGLELRFAQPLYAVEPGYEKVHPEYYSRSIPVGLMFHTVNSIPQSRKKWYTLDVEKLFQEEWGANLREGLELFSDTNEHHPNDAEKETIAKEAEFQALTIVYDTKYGPESIFADEHKYKLDHPEIGEAFRESLRTLSLTEGNTIVNMGVNDGYELHAFNHLYPGRDLLSNLTVYGVDVAIQALEKARGNFPGNNFHFIHGDGATLSGKNVNGEINRVPDNCADLYMALTSFQSTSLNNKRDMAFKSALRVLKQNKGKLLFAIPNCFYKNGNLVKGRYEAVKQHKDSLIAFEETNYISSKLKQEGYNVSIFGDYYIFILGYKDTPAS